VLSIVSALPGRVGGILSLVLLTLFCGCTSRDGAETTDGPWRASVDTLGNTVTVRTLEGSVWGGRAKLVETASIGTAEGEEYYLLGDVRGITADTERIFVLDWQVSTIRVYSQDGTFIRNIGQMGGGPGEFRDPIAIDRNPDDSLLFVRERVGGVIHVFSTDGRFLETRRAELGGNFSGLTKMLRISEAGDPYLFTTLFFPERGSPERVRSRYVMLGTGAGGAVFDTLNVPWYDFPLRQLPGAGLQPRVTVPFSPDKNWNMTPSRAMIGGVSDTYSFEIRHYDGRILRIERHTEPVPVEQAEAGWYFETVTERMRQTDPGWVWRGPAIPVHKPAFESFFPDHSGRVWVVRLGPGVSPNSTEEWRDTYLLDVFEEQTGRYLGEVEVPPGMRFAPEPYIRDERLIAYCLDAAGVPYVRSYRIEPPR
jgi:hypothetical protein